MMTNVAVQVGPSKYLTGPDRISQDLTGTSPDNNARGTTNNNNAQVTTHSLKIAVLLLRDGYFGDNFVEKSNPILILVAF